jgi:hypothetical protein
MLDRSSDANGPAPESYGRIVARPALVLVTLLAIAAWQFRPRPEPQTPVPIPPTPTVAKVVEPEAPPPPKAKARRAPRPTPTAPELDREAVARAEASLDQAARERARADARLAQAEKALQEATLQAAIDRAESRSIAGKVRDPSSRISAITTKGGFLKGERDKLKAELAAIERVPQTKSKALMAKSAVAKPTDGTEYHFEVRGGRVAFIDIDRLVEMVKTDARNRLRSGGVQRGRLSNTVGPVGSFSLHYELGRSLPDALAEIVDSRESSYNLLGWEIAPEGNNRGESYEATRAPSSTYARAINRLSPGKDTVTMWIYPDGFPLYRKLRDDLHARGFLVAARPLPEGTKIRGSPVGSVSAGQ